MAARKRGTRTPGGRKPKAGRASSGPATLTFLIYDRATGEVVGVHRITASAGAALSDEAALRPRVLREAAEAVLRAPRALDVLEWRGKGAADASLLVDPRTKRVKRRRLNLRGMPGPGDLLGR